MSDHLDEGFRSPAGDPRVDITDVYAFHPPSGAGSGQDLGRVVLAMGVNPNLRRRDFRPDARYEIAIDTNGDAREDIVFRATFSDPAADGRQPIELRRLTPGRGAREGVVLGSGVTGEVIELAGNIKLFAGIRDDPFFIDLVAFLEGMSFNNPTRGDSLAGKNVTAIVAELPVEQMGASRIGFWGRVSIRALFGGFEQVERAAHPEMNALFIPRSLRRQFNRTEPRDDRLKFRASVIASLVAGGDYRLGEAGIIADQLLPDILPFDLSRPSAFPNGRNLEDDVVDAVLKIATNNPAASDGVDANDVPFLPVFPYYAPPHA